MFNVVGWRFAEYELKTILAGIIRNFRITTDFKYEDLRFGQHVTITYMPEPKIIVFHR